MKNKKLLYLIAFLYPLILIGCTHSTPKCSDESTTSLVKKIIADEFGEKLNLTSKEIDSYISLDYILAKSIDEKIKKISCTAKLHVGELTRNILFDSQINDDNDNVVAIYGISDDDYLLHTELSKVTKISRDTAAQAKIDRTKMPSDAIALNDLFAPSNGLTKETGENYSVWFKKPFTHNNESFYSVFVVGKHVGENGIEDDCHICTVSVNAVNYKKNGNSWNLFTLQKNIAKIGSNGVPPELNNIESFQLSSNVYSLIIKASYSTQGESAGGVDILSFYNNEWADSGFIHLSGDNSGQCDNYETEEGDLKLGPCWGHTGVLSKIDDGATAFPNLVVKFSGTGLNAQGLPAPLIDDAYVHDGKKYVLQRG